MKLAWMICSVAGMVLAAGCETAPPAVEAFALPPPDTISRPEWAESGPAPTDYIRVYPPRAKRLAIESRVQLNCTVRDDRRLDCAPIWEEFADLDFGAAAVELSKLFVVKSGYDPKIKPGAKVQLPIAFRLVE